MTAATDTDSFVAEVFEAVAERLTATALTGHELRESAYLDPLAKDEFERRSGLRPLSQTLRTPDFPGIGPVDIVLTAPKALIELKWSYLAPDKIFESAWDAIKLALLGPEHGHDALYVVTGASLTAWSASECADLFRTGLIEPIAMWSRPLLPPRSPNRGKTVGEDLVIGGRGNQPRRVPTSIAVRHVTSARVATHYELRVARIAAAGPLVRWPSTEIEPVVAEGSGSPSASDASIQLPHRVTQRWIEATAPTLNREAIGPFLRALQIRGWNETDLRERVLPYLPPE